MRTETRLCVASGLRSLSAGLASILLGVHLADVGAAASTVALLVAAGAAANAAATLWVVGGSARVEIRTQLVLLHALPAAGLLALALPLDAAWLVPVAFFGLFNGSGKDRSAAQAIEGALLAATPLGSSRRTSAFVAYTLAGEIGSAAGALGLLAGSSSYRPLLVAGAAAVLAGLVVLRPVARNAPAPSRTRAPRRAPVTRRTVRALFVLLLTDSVGGGLLAASFLAFWFSAHFTLSAGEVGILFLCARLANAASLPLAERLAARIGLVRTMVFTHLPANLLLIGVVLAPSAPVAVALYLARESLSQMDVPARSSFITGILAERDRVAGLGAATLARQLGWAVGPALGAAAAAVAGVAATLLLGAGVKIVYDLSFFARFRAVAPPEEGRGQVAAPCARGKRMMH